jgi:hypothetical protein
MKTSTRIRPAPQAPKRTPQPYGPNSVVITDGTVTAGSVTFHAGEHHLFDPNGRWLGSYPTRAAALAALPKVSA